ncbi:hypothetical protein F2Q69_00028708 [Brassica cretica]|uniref:Uncharacterized protein n=1 Tax=Brassica cretica TaxID=69181 RepID=A0A8S9RUC6_BRACR|nr:hypothetical protein F2Q69_00028708 [Brassica cretica]
MHLLDSLTLQVEREERFRSRVKRYAGKWCSRGRSSSLLDAPLKLETLSGKLRTKEANSRFPSFADLIVKAHTKNQRIFSDRHRREGSKRLAGGGGDRYDECIKECDKAVERDRKHRPGKEQLLRKMEKSLDSCDQSVGEPGLSLKLWSEAC